MKERRLKAGRQQSGDWTAGALSQGARPKGGQVTSAWWAQIPDLKKLRGRRLCFPCRKTMPITRQEVVGYKVDVCV